ncbi:MAG TPA: hypothetical protein VN657_10520 [Nitrospiraceae bacterium]|jgi:hypothetical protein|nr:hypothetical protein [Nitrospiraceae bacterium]
MTCDATNYEPFLKEKSTRDQIMSAKNRELSRADPKRPIQFKVYNQLNDLEKPLLATGALSTDLVWLDARFTMPDGKLGFRAYDYQELTTKIADFK